tara:strand:+ start:3073 stop:4887 length:1815 start_codon:yes stop_codon:yes gene_type:complete
MAKVWKKLQRSDAAFTGDVTGSIDGVSAASIKSGASKGESSNQDSTATILGGTFTGNVTGNIDGVSAATIKTKAEAGSDAKSAVDGNSAITMVGGTLSIGTAVGGVYPFAVASSGALAVAGDEFTVAATGEVSSKGNFTINQDSNGDSSITLAGDSSGTAEVEVNGANPTFDLGGASPLGTSTLYIKRGGTGNQARIFFYTGATKKFSMGMSHQPSSTASVFKMHHDSIKDSTSPYTEYDLTFGTTGKVGFWKNGGDVAGVTIGTDGTNKHLYVTTGGVAIGGSANTTDGTLTVSGNATIGGSLIGASGSVGAPSYTFTGDTDTGMYRVSANALALVTGGVSRLHISSSGLSTLPGSITLGGNATVGGVLISSATDSYDKLRVWNSSSYSIGMKSAQSYGGLNDYAMTFTMNNDADRGFLWRDVSDSASDGAMSLTTGGILTVKGNATFGRDIDASSGLISANTLEVGGDPVKPGWHGHSRIIITPSDFIVNDDQSYYNVAMVDGGHQIKVTSTSLEAYAQFSIPNGYKATSVRLYGNDSLNVVKVYLNDITDATYSLILTGTVNALGTFTNVVGDSTSYISVKWEPTATSDYLYGGYITLVKV